MVDVMLKPEELRELNAIGETIASTDPTLARALSELRPPPGPGQRPPGPANPGVPPAAPALRWQLLGLVLLVGWTALGLAPLVVGLVLRWTWLVGVGAGTVMVVPIAGLAATWRLVLRVRERRRARE